MPDVRRQVVDRKCGAVGEDDGPLDHVFELPDVARPVIGREHLDGLRLDVRQQLAGPLGLLVEEEDGQLEDIIPALAESRRLPGESR